MAYSDQLIATIRNFLDERELRYKYDEEDCMFSLSVRLDCKLSSADLILRVRDDDFSVMSVLDQHADAQSMDQMAELVARMNYGMILGGFDMNPETGTVLYRYPVDCAGKLPSDAVLENAFGLTLGTLERYGDAILGVMMGFVDAKTACEKAEA